MYQQNQYLTMDLFTNTIKEFSWPCKYSIVNDLPDSIILQFPKSCFAFVENDDGFVTVEFLPQNTGGHYGLSLWHALDIYMKQSGITSDCIISEPVDDALPFASKTKTINGIRYTCSIILKYLPFLIDGDFSWVEAYLRTKDNE